MNPKVHAFARKAIWALPVWAATLVLGTLTHQPDPQTEFANFAAYVTTNQFLISHLVNSILGAAIGSIGAIGLMLYLQDSLTAGKAITGMVATVLSNTLNAAAFGAAAFTQPALGQAFLAGNTSVIEIYNLVYAAPMFGTIILALVLLLVGGVSTGLAIAGSGYFPRWAGWLYAAMIIALALSVFAFPAAQTLINGLLFFATLVVAWSAKRKSLPQAANPVMATAD
jgi:hypothetical protein